jgi:hypothetical protein
MANQNCPTCKAPIPANPPGGFCPACLLREADEPPLQVIPVKITKVAGYVDGQSVMPEGLLDALADDQVVNLVRYVRSLK